MRKKTFFGGLIIALAAIYPIASNYHGSKLHEHIDQKVADLNHYLHDSLGINYSVDARLEKSGIFASHYIVSIKDEKGNDIPFLQHDVEHGPFPWSNLKEGHFAPISYNSKVTLVRNQYTEQLFTSTKDDQPLLIEYSLGYDQQLKGKLSTARFKMQTTENGVTESSTINPYTLEFSADKDFKNIHLQDFSSGSESRLSDKDISLLTKASEYASSSDIRQQDKKLSIHSKSKIKDYFIDINDVFSLRATPIDSQFTLDNDGNITNIRSQASTQNLSILDTAVGQFETAIGFQRVNSDALGQLTKVMSNILVDFIRQGIQNNWQNSDEIAEQIMSPHILPLSGAGIALLNDSPLVTFGPIIHTNAGGTANIKADIGLLMPPLSASSQEEALLNSISDVDIQLSATKAWAVQTLMDVATITAKKHQLAAPSDQDKPELVAIIDDVAQALIASELAIDKDGVLQFTLKATPEKGKPIITTKTVTFNGEEIPVWGLALKLGQSTDKANALLQASDVSNRLLTFLARFGVKGPTNP
ncbi:DUF945 family protein [Pelistega europaea]|uniref:DUF945 family protein n=1 Tax=Pelistega europaea TaxID=106147 RepID=A0A7Y4L7S1_9BURK|nr:DUF945 family protein [Pelistega europaea]NOL48565.1 DUF945 family protein [Pelistega europaea]